MNEKKLLRKEILQRQMLLVSDAVRACDEKILTHILNLDAYAQSHILFCYVSMNNEPDTRLLIADALRSGKRVAVPLCTGKGIMQAREIFTMQDLQPGRYGIMEPKETCPLILPEQFDFAVIPCVSCSHEGLRLGHGGGFYDRYMNDLRAVKVCLCYEVLTCEEIPLEAHDFPIDILITESGVFPLQHDTI